MMAKLFLALLAIGFATAVARSDDIEPAFPNLFHGGAEGYTKIHISSERLDHDGGFTTADEYVDLELGKAAYIETTNNVRTTWLVDLKDNSVYKYWPFQCNKYNHKNVNLDIPLFPYIMLFQVNAAIPRLDVPGVGKMNVFGITGLLESFNEPPVSKKYSKISGPDGVSHKWVEAGSERVQAIFTENTENSELHLSSLIVKKELRTMTINILSIERSFSPEVYNNELQLPLIYGCNRMNSKLDDEMQKVFDLIAADTTTRYHLKTQARAINFAGHNPVSSEQKTIEFATSSERDEKYEQSPANAHMVYMEESCSGDCPTTKTVVDHFYNIKYEAKIKEGTCEITNAGQMKSYYETVPMEFVYSNGLKLSMKSKQFGQMLYGVETDNFLKLEKKGDIEYAYFSVTWSEVFSPKTTRVVRRYAVSNNSSKYKLDSIAIWIFENTLYNPKVAEVYDFKVVESKPLSGDANSAQAFDVGKECFLNNQDMHDGRDYAWFELDFGLSTERTELLKDKVDELKDAFYRSIRSNLNINYMRVPKMEIFFTESGFTLKLLVLDAPPMHLMYEEIKYHGLDYGSIQKVEQVSNLDECSEFCRKHSCTAMTFDRNDSKCSLALSGVDRNSLNRIDSQDTYRIVASNKEFLPRDAQRLERLIELLKSKGGNANGILGFNELNHLDTTKGFGNLRTSFKLNGQMVELVPVTSRVQSTKSTTEAPVAGS